MGMDVVVVIHPGCEGSESGLGNRDRVHTDIVALERPHEDLGNAITLRALDRSEAGIEVQRESDVDGPSRGVDRAVVAQPLDAMGSARIHKAASTQLTIMSRIISPESSAVVAVQPITSRSWQARTKATQTASPASCAATHSLRPRWSHLLALNRGHERSIAILTAI